MNTAAYQRTFLEALYGDEREPDLFTEATAHRFAAYSIGLRARFEESLLEAFPAVARILGHAAFHSFSREYLQSYPSRTWDLSRVGEFWPEFLAHPELRGHPYLTELARFEWLLHDLFFEADAGAPAGFPADADALSTWAPRFSSTLRVFRSLWAVGELHQQTEPADDLVVIENSSRYLVFRDQQGAIRYLALTGAQAALQEALLDGSSLGDSFDKIDGLQENDASVLAAAWTTYGLLR